MQPLKTIAALGLVVLGTILTPLHAQTVALPYQVVVNPIFVQNGPGGNIAVQSTYSASFALFQEATQRIFAQAGVRILWQAPSTYVSSTYYTVSDGTAVDNLVQTSGNGGIFDNKTVNIWFTGANGGILGVSQQSFNVGQGAFQTLPVIRYGGTVSESIFTSPYYSLTTLPHEIGHVLGLTHNIVNVGPPPTYSSTSVDVGNLMKGETVGATTFGQITTDGVTGIGMLSASQIAMLRLNPMIQTNTVVGDTYNYSAIPEPSTYALMAAMTAGLCVVARRMKRQVSKTVVTRVG